MLLRSSPNSRMFVSQPRRIAARALTDRVRDTNPDLKDEVGMRLGFGMKDESRCTRLWFCTTGYLTRLLAFHPEAFDHHTHLVIDEVHERSVDTDILCLLAKRLLTTNKKISLILMSATLAANIYKDYFSVSRDPIHVGVRTFPIKISYLEDILDDDSSLYLPQKTMSAATSLVSTFQGARGGNGNVNIPAIQKKQYALAVGLAKEVGSPGSSVLIFVSGMNDIVEITELVESTTSLGDPNVTYVCMPIHGDIPFDDQMSAFAPCDSGTVKIIIATNAAESSVTLPDVDHVICLGLMKQIQYNESTHRQILQSTWISGAAAKQRAGRTGRVREGNVYRLYTRNFHDTWREFERGEIKRVPLDSVILSLKEMLGESEAVTPVLTSVIEPPDVSHIGRAFGSLYEDNFIETPDDTGRLTRMGRFVTSIGLDLQLGRFVGLGFQFGVEKECTAIAAVLQQPRSPWRIANPLIHQDPGEYNSIMAGVFLSKSYFDGGMYSEPLSMVMLMLAYMSECEEGDTSPDKETKKTSSDEDEDEDEDQDTAPRPKIRHKKFDWCQRNFVASSRMSSCSSTYRNLLSRVSAFVDDDRTADDLKLKWKKNVLPGDQIHPGKVFLIRLILLWVFGDNFLRVDSKDPNKYNEVVVQSSGKAITTGQLQGVLYNEKRTPFELVSTVNRAFLTNVRDPPTSVSEFTDYTKAFFKLLKEQDAKCAMAIIYLIPERRASRQGEKTTKIVQVCVFEESAGESKVSGGNGGCFETGEALQQQNQNQ